MFAHSSMYTVKYDEASDIDLKEKLLGIRVDLFLNISKAIFWTRRLLRFLLRRLLLSVLPVAAIFRINLVKESFG